LSQQLNGGEREEHAEGEARKRHHRAISRRLVTAASVLLGAVACGDLGPVEDATLSTQELLVLPTQAGTPAVSQSSFFVPNNATTVRRLLHADASNTFYLELRFPSGSLRSMNDQPVAADDSVLVTAQPRSGAYGLVLSPSGMEFTSARPAATFSFARYGDLSVADGSATYASRSEYADALALWFEITPGRWRRVSGSAFDGADAVTGPIAEPGTYVVAAPR
jgi:hypothetical protein